MTIEKQLEVLKKSIELGGKVKVHFHQVESEDHAIEIMSEFTGSVEHKTSNNYQWFESKVHDIELTTFYEVTKADRIKDLENQLAKLKEQSA